MAEPTPADVQRFIAQGLACDRGGGQVGRGACGGGIAPDPRGQDHQREGSVEGEEGRNPNLKNFKKKKNKFLHVTQQ